MGESPPFRIYYSYILRSLKDNSFYYGSTSDLEKRLSEHNKGKVKYTKSRFPWAVHYYEKYNTRSEAVKRELFFKSIDEYRWLKENKII